MKAHWAMTIKNIIYVEANVMNMYAKFQLHPPYGFWEEDFWIFFQKIGHAVVIKISDLDKIYMVGRPLLQNHFCNFFFSKYLQ